MEAAGKSEEHQEEQELPATGGCLQSEKYCALLLCISVLELEPHNVGEELEQLRVRAYLEWHFQPYSESRRILRYVQCPSHMPKYRAIENSLIQTSS